MLAVAAGLALLVCATDLDSCNSSVVTDDDFDEADRQLVALHTFELLDSLRRTSHPDTVTPYYGEVSRAGMAQLLGRMELGESDRFLDFGCGVGRWLLAAVQHGCKHVFGIEYIAARADIARNVLGERATIMQGDGNDAAVWDAAKPSHVVAYDLLWRQEAKAAFEDTIARERCVRWVVRFNARPLPGFTLIASQVVSTHPNDIERFIAFTWVRATTLPV